METTRLSTKGQIVVPRKIRELHGWGPGTEFTVEETAAGILLRPAARFPETDLDSVAGCLRPKGKARSFTSMGTAVRNEVVRRHDRGRY